VLCSVVHCGCVLVCVYVRVLRCGRVCVRAMERGWCALCLLERKGSKMVARAVSTCVADQTFGSAHWGMDLEW
jgi:hypothetical protein